MKKTLLFLSLFLSLSTIVFATPYKSEVIEIVKNNGYQTFTIRITDETTGEIRVGERMFSPSEVVPKTQKDIDDIAHGLYLQFDVEEQNLDTFAGKDLPSKKLKDLPTDEDIDAVTTIEDMKVLLKKINDGVSVKDTSTKKAN